MKIILILWFVFIETMFAGSSLGIILIIYSLSERKKNKCLV
jgi:hypothetical protein